MIWRLGACLAGGWAMLHVAHAINATFELVLAGLTR